jgi:hypothetical protein
MWFGGRGSLGREGRRRTEPRLRTRISSGKDTLAGIQVYDGEMFRHQKSLPICDSLVAGWALAETNVRHVAEQQT